MKHIDIVSDQVREELDAYITGLSDADQADRSIQDKLEQARWIVDAVRKSGDAAVAECTERFDGVSLDPSRFEVTREEMDAAIATVDKNLIRILERAHENIRRFHSKNLRESWEDTLDDGTVLGQRITPVENAGVYVPGGKAFYPSTALMNITPARVAGVKEIIMVSPPTMNGDIHPTALAAARIAGAHRVFRIGGAQAIAALAYGTDTIPAVTMITGPGNTFVTAAKALVRGRVEIDSEAGPSEVLVLADDKANPAHVAAELLAQAEHDEEAMCLLVTPSAALIAAVEARIAEELPKLPRKDIIKKSLDNRGLLIRARTMDEAIAITNLYAPEHLSIQADYPRRFLEKITNAGAIMLGANTPVAVGDYYAGPNHTLPTGRKARFSSPLSAEHFRKVTSVLYYTGERLQREGADIMTFANSEELQAHARSIEVRL